MGALQKITVCTFAANKSGRKRKKTSTSIQMKVNPKKAKTKLVINNREDSDTEEQKSLTAKGTKIIIGISKNIKLTVKYLTFEEPQHQIGIYISYILNILITLKIF